MKPRPRLRRVLAAELERIMMIDWTPAADDLLHENAAGCLAGAAIGDAVREQADHSGAGEPIDQDKEAVRTPDATGLILAGTSEATRQTIVLAESIIDRKSFEPADLADRLSARHGSPVDEEGKVTELILERVARGEDWERAALEAQVAEPERAGNGSLARALPIALLHHGSPTVLIEDSRLSSRVTHPHSYCQWSCAFMNLVVAELLGGATPMKAVDSALAIHAHRGDVNRRVIERAKQASVFSRYEYLRPSSFVLDTLECSLWCLLHAQDFESTLAYASGLAGDNAVVRFVAAALAGAAYGLDSIPERWLAAVEESDRLEALALQLVELS